MSSPDAAAFKTYNFNKGNPALVSDCRPPATAEEGSVNSEADAHLHKRGFEIRCRAARIFISGGSSPHTGIIL